MALTKIKTDGIADGSVTNPKIADGSVMNPEIADDAINSEHYADLSINAAHLNNSSVTTNKIDNNAVTLAKLEQGTSSNDGKFLRANNGADPTFESLPASGPTLSGSTDNTIVTVTGSNAIQGEAKLTFDGSIFSAKNTSSNAGVDFNVSSNTNPRIDFNTASVGSSGIIKSEESGSGAIMEFHNKNSSGNEQQVITLTVDRNLQINDGNLIIGSGRGIDFSDDSSGTLKTLPNSFNAELLHDYENGTFTPNIQYDTGTNRYAGNNVSSAVGEYIRIGDLVNVGMKITLASNQNHTENTHIYIGGMPFNGMHSSQQSSMQNGWAGWACPSNDSNFSYKVHYCFHGYTTINLGFSQSSGNNGISGFYVWGFYRTAP